MVSSVYIHIPFCKHICSYCDFCKLLINNNWVNDYFKALAMEIDDFYKGETIKTIYIGGGTPSSLTHEQLIKLFKIIEVFKKSNDCEITFECNLNDINDNLLKLLQANKVNRVSIGIESFNKTKLELMERSASFKDALAKIKLIKYYGINNINVDLMYSIGNETLKDLNNDLKLFLKLPVTHISTYSLIIEEHTNVLNKGIKNVSEELEEKMYFNIVKKLKRHGFNHYEVSNFSKVGYESKHNLTYWHNEEYYGFGLGASGFIDNTRYTNTENITKYNKGEFLRVNNLITDKAKMDDELMLGLRLTKGINITEFNHKYQVNIYDLYPICTLIKNKDLILKKDMLYINPKKIYVMNEILLKMI